MQLTLVVDTNNATPAQLAAIISLINPNTISTPQITAPVISTPVVTQPVVPVNVSPAAVIAAAPVVTPPAAIDPNQRDSTGLPWDERIHSSSRSQKQNGEWTRRKGIDDATFNAVRAQLVGTVVSAVPVAAQVPVSMPAAAPVSYDTPPGVVTQPHVVTLMPPVNEVQQIMPPVSQAAPAPVAAVAPAAPQAPTVTWPTICQVMNQKMAEGKMNTDTMTTISTKYGVAPFAMLSTRSDLWANVYNDICVL